MTGADGERQAEILVELEDGGFSFVENFRGDLGDVTGEPVGSIAGHRATRYVLGDGVLVQWSEQGRWYGVFGWGSGAAETVGLALGMNVRQP